MLAYRNPRDVQREREIKERGEELAEERCSYLAGKIKNPPKKPINANVPEEYLIAAMHEECSLRQMQKNYDSFLRIERAIKEIEEEVFSEKETERSCGMLRRRQGKVARTFWKNQERFASAVNLGETYKCMYKWFLVKDSEFTGNYRNITEEELRELRKEYKRKYNMLCADMNSRRKNMIQVIRFL
jgi:hypothetical protein